MCLPLASSLHWGLFYLKLQIPYPFAVTTGHPPVVHGWKRGLRHTGREWSRLPWPSALEGSLFLSLPKLSRYTPQTHIASQFTLRTLPSTGLWTYLYLNHFCLSYFIFMSYLKASRGAWPANGCFKSSWGNSLCKNSCSGKGHVYIRLY